MLPKCVAKSIVLISLFCPEESWRCICADCFGVLHAPAAHVRGQVRPNTGFWLQLQRFEQDRVKVCLRLLRGSLMPRCRAVFQIVRNQLPLLGRGDEEALRYLMTK